MIFVTVGMHDKGFDRLLKAMDEFAGKHREMKVLMQTGSSEYVPVNAQHFTFKPNVDRELEEADLIVAHGGVSILHYRQLGKRILVVPRDYRLGEVFDDHQIVFMEQVQKRYKIPVLQETSKLEETILDVLKSPSPPKEEPQKTSLHYALDAYIQEIEAKDKNVAWFNFHDKLELEVRLLHPKYLPVFKNLRETYQFFEKEKCPGNPNKLVVELGPFESTLEGCHVVDETYYIKKNYVFSRYKHKIARWKSELWGIEQKETLLRLAGNKFSFLVFPYESLYQCFLFKLIRSGLSFVHALGLAQRDNAYLLIGRSGIGKSFIGGKSLQAGFQLLGDDTVFVDQGGMVYSFPLPIGFRNFDESLRDYQVSLKKSDKKKMRVYRWIRTVTFGYIALLFKVPSSRLAPGVLREKAQLASAIFAMGNPDLKIEPNRNKDEFVNQILNNIQFEFVLFSKLLNAYQCAISSPELEHFWEHQKEHWIKIMEKVPTYNVLVPNQLNKGVFQKLRKCFVEKSYGL